MRRFWNAIYVAAFGLGAATLPSQAMAFAQNPSASITRDLEAPGPTGPLRGTIQIPADKSAYPVVLIIPGSGPTDRDGNNGAAVKGAVYRQLADGLSARGVATVRIDKRGLFGSAAATPNPNAVTIGGYADDVSNWIRTIRQQTSVKCVWLLGHSEGGLIALKAVQSTPVAKDVCGVLLVASTGRRVSAAIRDQLQANPANAPVLPQAMTALDALDAGKTVDVTGMHPGLLALFNPAVQPYLIDLFSHDPAELVAKYQGPLLILQGGRDIQVGITDARRLSTAQPNGKLVVLPMVNHVFKQVMSDDRSANIATYGDAALVIDPQVPATIADFVLAKRRR